MLGPNAPVQLFVIAHPVEDDALQPLFVGGLQARLELRTVWVCGIRKPLLPFCRRQKAIDFPEWDIIVLAPPQAVLVHGQECEENLQILSGSSVAGTSSPRITARTRMRGLRPHHLPRPVSVWLELALRSL